MFLYQRDCFPKNRSKTHPPNFQSLVDYEENRYLLTIFKPSCKIVVSLPKRLLPKKIELKLTLLIQGIQAKMVIRFLESGRLLEEYKHTLIIVNLCVRLVSLYQRDCFPKNIIKTHPPIIQAKMAINFQSLVEY